MLCLFLQDEYDNNNMGNIIVFVKLVCGQVDEFEYASLNRPGSGEVMHAVIEKDADSKWHRISA